MAASDPKVECDPVKNTHSKPNCHCSKGNGVCSSSLKNCLHRPGGSDPQHHERPGASRVFCFWWYHRVMDRDCEIEDCGEKGTLKRYGQWFCAEHFDEIGRASCRE